MLRRWLFGGLALGMMASVLLAKPGVVTNKQGQTFKGDVTETDKAVTIDTGKAKLTVNKLNVASIQYDQGMPDQTGATPPKPDAGTGKDNKPATAPAPATVTQPAKPATPASKVPLEHRLLNADEINIIRLKEMSADDAKVKVKFENGLVKRYLATGDHDAAAFNALTPAGQALEIYNTGDAKLIKDIHVLNDPAPLQTYRLKIQPVIAIGCAAASCHGGTTAGGDFHLFTGNTDAATYTNFFILQTYSKKIDGVKYMAMDREVPDHSLVLQFGLPAAVGSPAHPTAVNWKPRFHTATDPAYTLVNDWLSKSLLLPQPEYGLKVSPRLPATQPAAP